METIAFQVADQFNCSFCGNVSVLHAENHCEDEDTNLSIVEITLTSRWILPEEMQVSVRFANFTFENLTVVRADISGKKNVNIIRYSTCEIPPSHIREYGSTLYIGLSRFPHRANTNRFRCNSLASKHFRPKF